VLGGAVLIPRWLVVSIAVLVCIMWAANLVVGYFAPERAAPGLNVIFMFVVGAVLTLDKMSVVRSGLNRLLNPPTDEPDAVTERGGAE
jgi:uncharacterized protein (DUF58 family)